ncbi:MAG: PQQ-binding-like beta-propeller repeat protein [Gammaproteobacteria bacterium]|nr:PQQ-binding-like beta-propeller repeat protein [Gammaproteobacteria bacterium]
MRHADQLPLARVGSYLFDRNCASCHDNPVMKAPTRDALSQQSRESLMITMEFGKMQPMAAHLSKQQRGLIALYLGGDGEEQYDWIAPMQCQQAANDAQQPWVSNWGLGLENRRYIDSSSAGINRDNVASLELVWSYAFPRVTDMRSQPAILGDTLFIGDKAGRLYALDRFTGCIRAHTKVLSGIRSALTLATLRNGKTLLIFADSMATLFAVDPDTLDIVWQKPVGISDYSVISGSISFYQDRLFVPISSYESAAAGSQKHACCTSHGAVLAVDAVNGDIEWTWHATEEARLQGINSGGNEQYGPSGASVWTTPAIDSKRNRLYFGTGNNFSHPASGTSDAIIALDIDTGGLVWKFQAVQGDVWNGACLNDGANCPENAGEDFDFGSSVIIAELPDDRQLLLAGRKSGEVFALDPDPEGAQGSVLWRNRISQGTSNGGIHWGMALAGDSLFVPVSDPERDTPGYTPHPGLSAIDIRNGERFWEQPLERECDYDYSSKPLIGLENTRSGNRQDGPEQYACSFYFGLSAAATATSELVFSGGLDGTIRAYDAATGEILWQAKTAVPYDATNGIQGHGGAIDVAGPVLANGWLYVLSGYSMFGQLPGNMLLAYKIQR